LCQIASGFLPKGEIDANDVMAIFCFKSSNSLSFSPDAGIV
jgi:hypothetical protein